MIIFFLLLKKKKKVFNFFIYPHTPTESCVARWLKFVGLKIGIKCVYYEELVSFGIVFWVVKCIYIKMHIHSYLLTISSLICSEEEVLPGGTQPMSFPEL